MGISIHYSGIMGTIGTLRTHQTAHNWLKWLVWIPYQLGLKRIRDMCREHGCPLPKIDADLDWYCLTFERLGAKEEQVTPQVIPQDAPQVTPQVRSLLTAMKGEMDRGQLQDILGLRARKNFRLLYLASGIGWGYHDALGDMFHEAFGRGC